MQTNYGRGAAVLSIAVLLLSGCGDKDEPTQSGSSTPTTSSSTASGTPPTSASPSASASPSTNPSIPAAARERTEAGAIAFLEFWFDEFSRGMVDPQNAPDLFAISDKDCIGCKKSQDLITEYTKGGWSVKQPGMTVVEPALATDVKADRVIINFTLEEISQPLYQNGKLTKNKVPAASIKKGAALKWVNDSWQAFDFQNL
ncbi:DUF6318 family protein [Knoellia subterranea]|uniref:DUF6318 domain-containing protein n=1 Tax=Knoellia subterranea KCTC 19937 TaxID=1385521 RepID=A0A0A0JQ49_9MICO|nr:DUF6318 family protein [Knoellia subterranea]KGN39550.1 hypothetical protein N803_00565 [Knoellia subterranea KCTC 19937]